MSKADIGLVGLAVMGENLVMNMESKGFTVAVYNRTTEKVTKFVEGRAKGKNIIGALSVEEFVSSLKKPRRIMIMVKAGKPVDATIEQLIPHLEEGDIIIDGGNSHYPDTIRRANYVESKGLLFIGTGVSGGEEGALNGPAIMPGGSEAAWPHVKDIFTAISAKAGEDQSPCCIWIGKDGAGHFVKMVHNGIEYGDMQLICEAYAVMKDVLGMTNEEIHKTFAEWNEGRLDSYLIEITRDIMGYKDENGNYVVDEILDTAGQKGTGKWTSQSALDEGIALTLISEAVFSRCLSALKEQRVAAAKQLQKKKLDVKIDREAVLKDLEEALFCSKVVSYAQGYSLMAAAAETYGWDLDMGGIAMIWRGGCIIRSAFLNEIKKSFEADPNLPNLMLAPYFKEALDKGQESWRRIVALGVSSAVAVPAMSSALAYFDGYFTDRLPANLLQAQRDYFGAHTFEKLGHPRGQFFHVNWTGKGGTTSASTYTV
ncbi:MAG: decarboxylating NADP(+)-dependent phosphogluconate dehydrogenase [Oscillospiraceae bacterium]|jgi:6-phosphogluconate dehydrogenase